jgi:PAS domain S-box-containing protein
MRPVILGQFMVAAAFVTVAMVHLFIWGRGSRLRDHLLFALTALAAALNSVSLALVYGADSIAEATLLYKWNVAFAGLWVIALTWFVVTFTTADAPRRWFAAALTAVFAFGLVANFLFPHGWIFSEVTGLRETFRGGERIVLPQGPLNPWRITSDMALLGLLGLVVDGFVRLWRGGQRRRAAFLCGSIAIFIVIFGLYDLLLDSGYVDPPYPDPYGFLLVALVMSYELAGEVARAPTLAREVEANERRWRALLDNVQLLVVGIDRQGCTTYVNPYGLKVLGYALPEVIGQAWLEVAVPDREHPRMREDFRRIQAGEPLPYYENAVVARSGEERTVRWSNVLLHDSAGAVAGILSVGEDVTDRRRAELEVQRQRGELAHVTRVSTMGELAGSFVHEINQPLTAILANAEAGQQFLAEDPTDLDELRHILADIVYDDNRATEVIGRIRALVRKEAPVLAPVDLVTIVDGVSAVLHSDAMSRRVRVLLRAAPDLPTVCGDAVQLQQVVMNLLLNAFSAMQATSTAARDVLVQIDRDGPDHVRVSVRDRGHGIPHESLDRIFETFFTTKRDGLGMGLSICRSIIDAHRGRIWAENNGGGGATVCFTLPTGASPVDTGLAHHE